MRAIVLTAVALVVAGSAQAGGSHSVRGYIKRDGTYVAPAHATNPNSTRVDNWSTKPNVNPYTGQTGTKSAYPTPSFYKAPKTPKSTF